MKKIINNPENVVEEMVEGFMEAFHKDYDKVDGVNGIVRKEKQDKVGVVIGGGSGHEPMFLGFVGEGLADGVAIGNVFAAPPPNVVQEVAKAVDSGKGVLFVYGNYAGDILNFDMAAELLEFDDIETKTVLVCDDCASAPKDKREDRRGIAGDLFVFKIAGAAADSGRNLDEVAAVTQKASDHTHSIGVALSPGSIPDSCKPTFELADDEIEFGMGIHGEPGIKRTKMMEADKLVTEMVDLLLDDCEITDGDEVVLLVNGLGSTTLLEQFIVNRKVNELFKQRGIHIYDTEINSHCTTQEMGGVSISIMKLDDELKELYDMPAYTPYYHKK